MVAVTPAGFGSVRGSAAEENQIIAANKTTPVIVVSMMADQHTQIACRSLGVSDYVVKPIERPALLRAVKGALAA